MTSLRPTEPLLPFSTWPIQFSDPDVGFAWYAGNGTVVTQATSTHGTARTATVISDWIDQMLDANGADVARAGGLLGIHDWRRVQKYDSAARKTWIERIHRRPKGYLRKAVVIIADNPLLKMAIAGANLFVAVASRDQGQIEISTNAYETLRKYAVRTPVR
jgi:hypothetical protein